MNHFHCQLDDCEYHSKFKANVKKHMLAQHDSLYIEQTVCELCHIDFGGNKPYELHRKQHHPTDEEVRHQKELRKARNRRYYLNKKLGL